MVREVVWFWVFFFDAEVPELGLAWVAFSSLWGVQQSMTCLQDACWQEGMHGGWC